VKGGKMRKKSTAELKAANTYRADRHAARSQKVKTLKKVPSPPAGLPASGKTLWRKFAALLIERKILAESDLTALSMLIDELLLYAECQKILLNEGLANYLLTHNIQNGLVLTVRDRARKNIIMLLGKFYLTPADRCRVQTITLPAADQADDDLDILAGLCGGEK
jgi:P27 family predicted phage terminase small subunit